MGVDIDEAGGDEEAGDVDNVAGGRVADVAHRGDPTVTNRDVAWCGGPAGAVEHGTGTQDHVEVHVVSLP